MLKRFGWEFFFVACLVLFVVSAVMDKRPTYDEANLKTEVLVQPYIGSNALIYRWSSTVLRNCRGVRRRHIEQNEKEILLEARTFTWLDDWDGPVYVDPSIPVRLDHVEAKIEAGPASYHVSVRSYCNLFQVWFDSPVSETYPPVHFVIKKES